MLDSLITSKTRIKLLMKFFINSNVSAHLRNLASEFGDSTNGIRQELNRLEEAHLLESELVQNKKIYRANTLHPFYEDIHHLLLKYVGIDRIVDEIIRHVAHIEQAFIINDFALGKPNGIMDLVLVGDNFDEAKIDQLIHNTEKNVKFKVRYLTVSPQELPEYITDHTNVFQVWSADNAVRMTSLQGDIRMTSLQGMSSVKN